MSVGVREGLKTFPPLCDVPLLVAKALAVAGTRIGSVGTPAGREFRVIGHASRLPVFNHSGFCFRIAFPESVIGSDLPGQREFSWGEAFCRLDTEHNKDWLIIVYTVGPRIPLHRAELLRELYEHEPVANKVGLVP